MSRPDNLPSWCDDDSSAKVTEPSDTKKLQGWIYKERPAFDFWNWMLRHFVKWFTHFDVSVNHFDPHEASAPNMTVVLTAGRVQNGITLTEVAEQTTSAFTAPSANPRIDRIVIDNVTGIYSIIAGSEAASPVAPAITLGKIAIAQVLLQTTSTSITASMITDERPSKHAPLIDEDNMASDSDTVAPTQQSTKAYVEAYADTGDAATLASAGSYTDTKIAGLNTKVIEIGDWDMDATVNGDVSHGISDHKKIRSISVIIRDDADTTYSDFSSGASTTETTNKVIAANSTTISMPRATGGVFDTANYSATSYNRGWITIQYTD